MPLAYASTLDRDARRLRDRRRSSYVEALWSPSLACPSEMRELKLTHIFQRIFKRDAQRSLSLSGGASIRFSSSSS